MPLAPFGILKEGHRRGTGRMFTPMTRWSDNMQSPQDYRKLIETWLDEIAKSVWPEWSGGSWVGDAATDMESRNRAELEIAVKQYHGGGGALGTLEELPNIPPAKDGVERDQQWHYDVEDARLAHPLHSDGALPIHPDLNQFEFDVSESYNSNYVLYDPSIDITFFEKNFLRSLGDLVPSLFDIKGHFQRPRPWATAAAQDVSGFRWVTSHHQVHTGVHPSLLSGHCIQGILGGCNVLDVLLTKGKPIPAARLRAIQKYMVDWGDRRVFAGVHYMTDNIASWTLARRLIPHLFDNAKDVEALAVEAITQHSRVFADIVAHFTANDPARTFLLQDFPEAIPTS